MRAYRGGYTSVLSKSIEVRIYKGDGDNRKLCTTLSLNRVDPVSFDSEINMVTNDSDSDSLYKAMSADAFKDLVDSKVTDDKNSESDELSLSANALKEYLKDKLEVYSKTSDSVWYDGNSAVGSDYQGVYVKATGEVLPGSVVYRGNVTNAPHALVIVPFLGNDNVWHYDFVDRADLYTKFIDQLYFTFTIKQSPHQTITVTTADGVEHTESFSVKYGTKWTASIVAAAGYNPGTLSAVSGTVKGATTISATEAKMDTSLYGFEIGNNGRGGNIFYEYPSKSAYVGCPVSASLRDKSCLFIPSPYSNIVHNGANVKVTFTAPANCTMIAIQYTWPWGGDEAPNCFSVKANGVEWWQNRFAGSNWSGPVSRLNNGNPANFVKVTPGKTYNISFSGQHGYKGRNYGLRFFWGAQINSSNYKVRVDGDG